MPGSAAPGAFPPGAEETGLSLVEVPVVEELPPGAVAPPVVTLESLAETEAREKEERLAREKAEREARERKEREERERKEREEGKKPPPPPPVPIPEHVEPGERGPSDMAVEAYASLAPIATGDMGRGFPLRALVRALSSMFQQVEEAVRAKGGRDSWEQTFDVNRTPDFLVPFVGQAIGVQVTPGVGAAAQRQQVSEERAWKRGRPAQIIGEVQEALTGLKRVRLIERTNGDAWTLTIITRPEETPNLPLLEAIVRNAVPGGIKVTLIATSLPTIDDALRTIDAAEGTIDTATVANVT